MPAETQRRALAVILRILRPKTEGSRAQELGSRSGYGTHTFKNEASGMPDVSAIWLS